MDASFAHFFAAPAGYPPPTDQPHIPPLVPPPAASIYGHALSFGSGQAASGFGSITLVGHESPDDASDDDPDAGGSRGTAKKPEREIKRRSTKACDNCRKSKCKCTRAPLSDGTTPTTGACQNCVATGAECTFNGASRKRGPPKGYIEAIESRLHRMEALLGGLLQSDDPRAQALLTELIGDNEARDMLKQDLKAATDASAGGKARKSWKLPPLPPLEPRFGPYGAQAGHLSLGSSGTLLADIGPHRTSPPDEESDSEGDAVPLGRDDDRSRAQRRKLNGAGSQLSLSLDREPNKPKTPVPGNTIPHTGKATYSLSGPSTDNVSPSGRTSMSPDLDSDSVHTAETQHFSLPGAKDGEPLSELADVVGQLSLDENGEVRYHGRSAGLYLISKSQRYRNFFWRFPRAGVWPRSTTRNVITEAEAHDRQKARDALPPREEMDHLLEIYWAHVHPSIPVLYKIDFMRQYRSMMLAPDSRSMFPDDEPKPSSQEPSGPDNPAHAVAAAAGSGPQRITVLLLLVMFSLAARFSDRESKPVPGEYWDAGDKYLEKAKRVLNQEYARSKLSTCQALLLLAYREIGVGAMAESWLYTGMSIRMAQDMGMFRDVEKWFMPVNKFSYDEKQTRKRVWWTCIVLDKYVSTYIGRPMMIFERDYDTTFPSAEEADDEHEQWRPIRPDGSDLSIEPSPESLAEAASFGPGYESDYPRPAYPPHRCYAISCFNRSASLSILTSRIVANIYAIRVRVIGQSSETLLSLLDQNLVNWYLDLPEHLQYSPSSSKAPVPPPHVLTLHAQFYTALILLHRPFITGQQAPKEPSAFPSHSICTTAANAIATIATTFSKTFGLRQAPAFMVYYIFTAAILHVYNSTFDPGMAVTGKRNLLRCMNSLKEMSSTWGGAVRAWELLVGLVDLRDVDLSYSDAASPPEDRGTKRPAVSLPLSEDTSEALAGSATFQRLPTFHTRTPSTSSRRTLHKSTSVEKANSGTVGARKTKSVSARPKSTTTSSSMAPPTPALQSLSPCPPVTTTDRSASGPPIFGMTEPQLSNINFDFSQPTPQTIHPPSFSSFQRVPSTASTSYGIFGLSPQGQTSSGGHISSSPQYIATDSPSVANTSGSAPSSSSNGPMPLGVDAKNNPSFGEMFGDFLPQLSTRSALGVSGAVSNALLTPSIPATTGSGEIHRSAVGSNGLTGFLGMPGFGLGSPLGGGTDLANPFGAHVEHLGSHVGLDTNAFFGMPLSADAHAEDWQSYLPTAFFSSSNVFNKSPGRNSHVSVVSSASPEHSSTSPATSSLSIGMRSQENVLSTMPSNDTSSKRHLDSRPNAPVLP